MQKWIDELGALDAAQHATAAEKAAYNAKRADLVAENLALRQQLIGRGGVAEHRQLAARAASHRLLHRRHGVRVPPVLGGDDGRQRPSVAGLVDRLE